MRASTAVLPSFMALCGRGLAALACLVLPLAPVLGTEQVPDPVAEVAYGNQPRQQLDIYTPPVGTGPWPTVVLVHGGAWFMGDKRGESLLANKVNRWLAQGLAIVSLNYRLVPDVSPLEQADDLAQALARLRDMAADWQLDPAQTILVGHSAGAHLVALLNARTTDPGWLGTVLIDSAALDVVQLMSAPHHRFYDRAFRLSKTFWQQASPWHQLQAAAAPMLLICSSLRPDACDQADSLVRQATRLGVRAERSAWPIGHRALNEQLGLATEYTQAVEAYLGSLSPAFASRLGRQR